MRKKLLVLAFILISFNYSSAQQVAEIGFASGVVNYVGDLGNERYLPYSSASPGYQLTLRNILSNNGLSGKVNRPFSLELRFSWHRLQYDETQAIGNKKGVELRNYLRGIGFRNDLFGASMNVTYTFYSKRFSSQQQKFCYFLLAGVGVYHGNPTADLFNGEATLANRYHNWSDGTIRDAPEKVNPQANIIGKDGEYETNLRDWKTEAQGINKEFAQNKPYHNTNIGFPLGIGVRYGISNKIRLSMELDYYYFLTDYLDDVSDRYATYNELKTSFPDPEQYEIAKYISDPTGKGTNGFIGSVTSPRGNSNKNDGYTFVSIEVAYQLIVKKKILWNNFSKH